MTAITAARPASPWPPVAATLALLVLGVLLLYRDTAAAIVEIWARSDTFSHGFFVVPIVLWLLWRRRAEIAAQTPEPALWVLLPLAGAGVLWLLGELAAVNAATQFALMAMVVLLVPAVAGLRATRAMLFPLAFLFFAVPIGEFMMPWLMARTADFTVFALRTTGIPVYREGLQFIIPSGAWSVVEACSGVRYLIASLMVGTLFAYLNYRSPARRWIFVGVSLLVPIVANWLRAYFIVLLGHYSGNTVAVGVDHLIYGWLFFGVVMVLMFVIGMRWSQPEAEPARSTPASLSTPAARACMPWAAAGATALMLLLPVLAHQGLLAREDATPPQWAEPALPAERWSASFDTDFAWTPAFQNPTLQWQRDYRADGHPVGLYVGYYRQQGGDRKLVSSSNELVRSADKAWNEIGTGPRTVALPDAPLTVRTARLRRPPQAGDGTALAVWQLYWANGTWTASDARAKLHGALSRLLGRGDDGAVLILYAAEQQPGDADARLEALLRDALPAVEAQLRRTRDGR